MKFWFFSAGADPSCRRRHPAVFVRPLLEPLEDRCLPSANAMPASTPPAAANTIASLSHDQIHQLQAQSQQQAALATVTLQVEQAVFGVLHLFAPQAPQFQPALAFLARAIPGQQAAVNSLVNQTNLLNQLDDLQDQSLMLNAQIQSAAALVPMLQQLGDAPAANALNHLIFMDQAAVRALQPQIAAVETAVSAFV